MHQRARRTHIEILMILKKSQYRLYRFNAELSIFYLFYELVLLRHFVGFVSKLAKTIGKVGVFHLNLFACSLANSSSLFKSDGGVVVLSERIFMFASIF